MCLSHLIYTVRPCLIHTCYAAPMPCSNHAGRAVTLPSHHCSAKLLAPRKTGCIVLVLNTPLKTVIYNAISVVILGSPFEQSFTISPQHGRRETAVLCRGLEKNGMVGTWRGRGMASVNQTRTHCVNQMGKTHSKPLGAWHGRGTAWARHGRGLGAAWARHGRGMCAECYV